MLLGVLKQSYIINKLAIFAAIRYMFIIFIVKDIINKSYKQELK